MNPDPNIANIQALYAKALTDLVLADAVPADQRVRMTYTLADRTVGWNEWRASRLAEVDNYADRIKSYFQGQVIVAGGFEIVDVQRG